jgi:hypothetical protein
VTAKVAPSCCWTSAPGGFIRVLLRGPNGHFRRRMTTWCAFGYSLPACLGIKIPIHLEWPLDLSVAIWVECYSQSSFTGTK